MYDNLHPIKRKGKKYFGLFLSLLKFIYYIPGTKTRVIANIQINEYLKQMWNWLHRIFSLKNNFMTLSSLLLSRRNACTVHQSTVVSECMFVGKLLYPDQKMDVIVVIRVPKARPWCVWKPKRMFIELRQH